MNAAGNATSRMRYHPYGQVWTQSAATATDKLFTGHTRLGARSGMYYAGARFYSADLGRFMSADSIVPGAGDPQALNRYAYVRGNPLRYSDPTGHYLADMTPRETHEMIVAGQHEAVQSAFDALGQDDPMPGVGDPPDSVCPANCDDLQLDWILKTRRAAWTLDRIGDVNMFQWSWDQRWLLSNLGFPVTWPDQPVDWETGDYTIAAAAAGGLLGAGMGLSASGSVPKAELGTFWKSFQADFKAGNLNDWRVASTGSASSLRYKNAVNTEVLITNTQTGRFTYGQLQWRMGVTTSGVPYIQPIQIHPRPYPKTP